MASVTEEVICWLCSEYANVFPELMASISNLKRKKRKTDEDNILEEIISKGNTEITEKSIINNIFEYAVQMNYISRNTYKDHFTYKINPDIIAKGACKSCGENINPYDGSKFDVNSEVKYVEIEFFEKLAIEFNEVKKRY